MYPSCISEKSSVEPKINPPRGIQNFLGEIITNKKNRRLNCREFFSQIISVLCFFEICGYNGNQYSREKQQPGFINLPDDFKKSPENNHFHASQGYVT